jgi:hypothetical protein
MFERVSLTRALVFVGPRRVTEMGIAGPPLDRKMAERYLDRKMTDEGIGQEEYRALS